MSVKSKIVTQILNSYLEKRKKESTGVSLRSIAKKIGVSHSYLSLVFRGRRSLSSAMLEELAGILDFSYVDKEILISEVLKKQGWARVSSNSLHLKTAAKAKAPTKVASKKDFFLLENWYLFAILEATCLRGYDGTAEYLAKKLSLSVSVVRSACVQLHGAGMLQKDSRGYLVKADANLEFQSLRQQRYLSSYQLQVLHKAKKVIEEQTTDAERQRRFISSMNFTCSKESLPTLKMKMMEFMRDIGEEVIHQDPEEVYTFGVLFFPLTTP